MSLRLNEPAALGWGSRFAHTSHMLDYDDSMSEGVVSESVRDTGMCDCSSLKTIKKPAKMVAEIDFCRG